jgi:anti-sigma factor RsiW
MNCREMALLLSDYIDGDLEESMRALIDAHDGACPPCHAFVRTLARTVEAVRRQPREPLSPALRKALCESLARVPR